MLNKIPRYAILFALFLNFSCKEEQVVVSVISAPGTNNVNTVSLNLSSVSVSSSYSTALFQQFTNGYQVYRIPALLTTIKGTILAFCEARKLASSNDSGDIDVVFRRSTDNGQTWSDQKIVFDDGANTCGNPTLVQDKKTNTIWLLMNHNPGNDNLNSIVYNLNYQSRTVWVSKSDDDGITWSTPQNITSSVKAPTWTFYATGPGTGIQITHGPHSGRLIIPCDHIYLLNNTPVYESHIIFSDNDGQTWQLGGSSGPFANECQVVELNDGKGTLLMNSRYVITTCRTQAVSSDGGITWSSSVPILNLIDPNCEASILSYTANCLLFCNNAINTTTRANLTLKSSFDYGVTWNNVYTICKGPSAYSSLSVLSDGSIACLFETGVQTAYENITFNTFKTTVK